MSHDMSRRSGGADVASGVQGGDGEEEDVPIDAPMLSSASVSAPAASSASPGRIVRAGVRSHLIAAALVLTTVALLVALLGHTLSSPSLSTATLSSATLTSTCAALAASAALNAPSSSSRYAITGNTAFHYCELRNVLITTSGLVITADGALAADCAGNMPVTRGGTAADLRARAGAAGTLPSNLTTLVVDQETAAPTLLHTVPKFLQMLALHQQHLAFQSAVFARGPHQHDVRAQLHIMAIYRWVQSILGLTATDNVFLLDASLGEAPANGVFAARAYIVPSPDDLFATAATANLWRTVAYGAVGVPPLGSSASGRRAALLLPLGAADAADVPAITNANELLAALHTQLGYTGRIVAVSASANRSADLVHGFADSGDLLISAHSVLLRNLIFTRPATVVVEVQAGGTRSPTPAPSSESIYSSGTAALGIEYVLSRGHTLTNPACTTAPACAITVDIDLFIEHVRNH